MDVPPYSRKKKEKAETGLQCMPFCHSEPPPPPRRYPNPHSCERKEELNRGASKERKAKDKKPAAKDTKKAELQKRQEKPISFIDCPVCHKVLKNAVEIECGHVFCNRCIRRKMGRSKQCPICKSEIEYIHPSYLMRELVRKFGVKDGQKRLKAELLQVSGYYDEYTTEDPIVIAAQFVQGSGGGAFDPADLYKTARLDEYVSVDEYLDTIKMVNQIISSWTSGRFTSCMGSLCFCVCPSPAQKAVNMIEVVLGDCNLRWPETGLFWTLLYMDGDTQAATSLGDSYYLVLRIDPSKARAYQNTLKAGGQRKDAEMARLRKQNALMRHKMLELGENGFIRALAGRKSRRYSLKSSASLAFVDEYPEYPVISPHTLRDLVLHNPASKRPFITPWNRMRSTSTGPLPLTREEDCRMKTHLTTMISSRSASPMVDRSGRSPSPAARPKSSSSEKSPPWK